MRWLVLVLGLLMAPVWAANGGKDSAAKTDDGTAWAALADVLENPAQRKALVAELRRLEAADKAQAAKGGAAGDAAATATTAPADAAGAAAADAQADGQEAAGDAGEKKDEGQVEAAALQSVAENARAAVVSAAAWPKKVAEAGVQVLREVGSRFAESWDALVGAFSGRDLMLQAVNWAVLRQTALNLALIVAVSLSFLWVLHRATRGGKARLQDWVLQGTRLSPLSRRLLGVAAVALGDGLLLFCAYVCANVLAVFVVGESGVLSTQAAFFVRALVAVEGLRIGIRMVFYPRFPGLRLLPCTDKAARFWNRWFATLVQLLGYGYLVVLPLIKIFLSPSLGQVFSALLALCAFFYGVVVVIRQRTAVRLALRQAADGAESAIFSGALRVLAPLWHWLAIVYFSMLLVLTLLSGEKSLPFVLRGTLYSLLLVGGGLLASMLLSQWIRRPIRFAPDMARRLPGLEKRLNFFVPLALRLVRLVLVWLVFVELLATWHVVDVAAWEQSALGHALLARFWNVCLILAVAVVVWLVSVVWIERFLSPEIGGGAPGVRTQTLLSLLRSGWAVVVFACAALMVLTEVGINIGPLIAGAGVFGLAVGFGAQTLVKDVITGIFFQIENAINTGDIVTVDGITGRAEQVGIRSVGIRDSSGTYHLIPFSNVTRVSNYMRGHANHIAEYGIAYRENVDEAMEQLRAAFNELVKGEMKRYILEPINIQGVSQLADSAVMLRVSIKTTPGDQWAVGRAYNRLVKMYFDAAGIEMPFPHMEVYFGQDKDGNAPPLHIRHAPEEKPAPAAPVVEKSAAPPPAAKPDDLSNLPDSGSDGAPAS